MNRRNVITAGCVATVAIASSAAAQPLLGDKCPGPGPQTLEAAGVLLLLASAEHGADALRMIMVAVAQQASPGC